MRSKVECDEVSSNDVATFATSATVFVARWQTRPTTAAAIGLIGNW